MALKITTVTTTVEEMDSTDDVAAHLDDMMNAYKRDGWTVARTGIATAKFVAVKGDTIVEHEVGRA